MASVIISKAEEMNPRFRSTMEDCVVFQESGSWNCLDSQLNFVGVYDGHGGREIVEFLEHSLVENVAEELNVDEDVDMDIRLQRAFLITDIQSYDSGIMTSGATVAMCLFKRDLKLNKIIIHAANAGDARAVLSCSHKTDNPKAYRLTHDHRADDPEEIKRIQEAGGFVLRNRVLGILAVARSLGDNKMKEFVICKPFVQSVQIDIDPDYDTRISGEFIIIACDGLWDVMDDQEAVDLVRTLIVSTVPNRDSFLREKDIVAKALINEALKRGSTDNISVIVAWL